MDPIDADDVPPPPVAPSAAPPPPPPPPATSARPLDDPRALPILTAELSSLVAARSLVYNESFTRTGMFLAFLSTTLVALGLVAGPTGFGDEFLVLTAAILGIDLFIGVATLGRLIGASREDLRYLQGMNRVRHAFHEMRPELAPYFITGHHDDMRGVFATYGPVVESVTRGRASILHGLTTMPAMVSVVCACLAGTIAGALLLLVVGSVPLAAIGTVIVLVLVMAGSFRVMAQSIQRTTATLDAAFPSDPR